MKVLLLSNLFPSAKDTSFGTFVKITSDILSSNGVDVQVVAIKGRAHKIVSVFKYLIFYLKVFYCCCFGKYDIVYFHFYTHIYFIAFLPLFIRNKKYIINIHGGEIITISAFVKILRDCSLFFLRKATAIVVPSTFFKDILTKEFEISEKKLMVWPSGGVDDVFFLQESPNCSNLKTKIGYVSRIDYGKGWELLLDAILNIKDWKEKYELHFIGGGKEVVRFKNIIAPYLSDKSIVYHGSLSHTEMISVFKTFDLFVFPTVLEESLGLVGLEAMALGIPVVATRCGGISEYLKDGYNGFFFEKGNSNDLRDRIEYFKTIDKDTLELYKSRAKETALKFKSSIVAGDLIRKFQFIYNE